MKTAIIIGAGPAGLTAAYELLKRTDIKPIIFESSDRIGGISTTIEYKGNRIDIGGHRFFSKSDRVMDWWFNIFALQGYPSRDDKILNRQISTSSKSDAPDPEKIDSVMLVRNRLSRIFFLKKFFNYPISLNFNTLKNLGLIRVLKVGLSYIKIKIFPIKEESSLEDFYINRFGNELYKIFFKDYTKKLWGVPCNKIKADWGAQRVKGLSISKAIFHSIKKSFFGSKNISNKKVETSLIDSFYYPKFGPGQIWSRVAEIVKERGAKIYLEHEVVGFESEANNITKIKIKNLKNNELKILTGDYIFSSMPIKDLFADFAQAPQEIREIASQLQYRDFITVGLLLNKLKIKNETKIKTINNIIPDTWIYIQEPEVKMCRMQIFNNWSPYLVKDINNVWIGLEYVCSENDELWQKQKQEFIDFAICELENMGIIDKKDVIDSTLIKMKKVYPSYIGAYEKIGEIKKYLNKFDNLFCIGRNGMHKYNNMDHSMLTAMVSVDNIIKGIKDKDNIWNINSEQEYHESR